MTRVTARFYHEWAGRFKHRSWVVVTDDTEAARRQVQELAYQWAKRAGGWAAAQSNRLTLQTEEVSAC